MRLRDVAWHVDGSSTRQCYFHPFSLLVGVAISDCGPFQKCSTGDTGSVAKHVDDELHGNLCVWPGSHKDLTSMPARRICSAERASKLNTEILGQHGESLGGYEGLPAELFYALPSPGLGPRPLRLRRGDCVILHPELAHAGAPNYCPDLIRAMAYFRLRSRSHCSSSDAEAEMARDQDFLVSDLAKVSSSLFFDLPGVLDM